MGTTKSSKDYNQDNLKQSLIRAIQIYNCFLNYIGKIPHIVYKKYSIWKRFVYEADIFFSFKWMKLETFSMSIMQLQIWYTEHANKKYGRQETYRQIYHRTSE